MSIEAISHPAIRAVAAPQRIRPVSFWAVLGATVIMNLRIAVRYLPNLLGDLVVLGIRLFQYFLLASVVTFQGQQVLGRPLTGRELFVFYQGATLLFIFKGTALWTPLDAIYNDLYNGTLEFLYSSPVSRYAYYMGRIISSVLFSMVAFLPVYLTLIMTVQVSVFDVLMVLVVCLAVFAVLIPMGIMMGLLGLLWRRASSIAGIIDNCFDMLSGAYFPLAALPGFILPLTYPLPFTWGYDLIRYYSFGGQWHTILPVWQEWSILLVFGVAFTILSRYLLAKTEAYAKKNGLHLL